MIWVPNLKNKHPGDRFCRAQKDQREGARLSKRIVLALVTLCGWLGAAQAQDKPEVFPQLGHSGGVYSVAFSPDWETAGLG